MSGFERLNYHGDQIGENEKSQRKVDTHTPFVALVPFIQNFCDPLLRHDDGSIHIKIDSLNF